MACCSVVRLQNVAAGVAAIFEGLFVPEALSHWR